MALDRGKKSSKDFSAHPKGVAPPAPKHIQRAHSLLALKRGLHPSAETGSPSPPAERALQGTAPLCGTDTTIQDGKAGSTG